MIGCKTSDEEQKTKPEKNMDSVTKTALQETGKVNKIGKELGKVEG